MLSLLQLPNTPLGSGGFCLREELLAMPFEQGKAVSQLFLDTAKIILNEKPKKFEINESVYTSNHKQISELGKWYASLKLTCPFLLNNLCTSYEHRPIACREHIVTGSALLCEDEWSDSSQIVQMPISILECLG